MHCKFNRCVCSKRLIALSCFAGFVFAQRKWMTHVALKPPSFTHIHTANCPMRWGGCVKCDQEVTTIQQRPTCEQRVISVRLLIWSSHSRGSQEIDSGQCPTEGLIPCVRPHNRPSFRITHLVLGLTICVHHKAPSHINATQQTHPSLVGTSSSCHIIDTEAGWLAE